MCSRRTPKYVSTPASAKRARSRARRAGRAARSASSQRGRSAALDPDTKDGYLYFLAKGDGSKTTAFAKTLKEHQANVKKYMKPPE